MAIFAGNDIQRIIERETGLLGEPYFGESLPRLNSSDPSQSLGAEWEIMVVSCFSRCGTVKLLGPETRVSNLKRISNAPKRNPDFIFEPDSKGPLAAAVAVLPQSLLVEVTAVSDAGYEDANPRIPFYDAFNRLLSDHKLPRRCFGVDLRGELINSRRASKTRKTHSLFRPNLNHGKMQLLLPPRRRIDHFVKTYLGPWIKEICSNPSTTATLTIDEKVDEYRVRLEARYNPTGEYFSPGGFPGYTEVYSISRNPVANRLERKVEQIRKSGFDGVAGIILCDAHCSLLADRGGYSPMTFNLRQVVSHFCNHPDHTRVSFAITLSPEEIISGGRISTPITRVQSFFNPKARHPINEDGLDVLVRAICDQLPNPVNTAVNAVNLIKGIGGFPEGLPHASGYRVPCR